MGGHGEPLQGTQAELSKTRRGSHGRALGDVTATSLEDEVRLGAWVGVAQGWEAKALFADASICMRSTDPLSQGETQ